MQADATDVRCSRGSAATMEGMIVWKNGTSLMGKCPPPFFRGRSGRQSRKEDEGTRARGHQ